MNESNESLDLSYKSQPNSLTPNSSGLPEDNIPIVYFGISVVRLVCLFLLTFGFYKFYWFYKNWKAIKNTERSDISPFWRSCFSIFFCHELFEKIEEAVTSYSNKKPFSASWLSGWYIIFCVIGLGFFNLFILMSVQKAINFNNKQLIPGYKPLKKFDDVEIIFIIIGSLLWLIGILRGCLEA